MPPTQGPAITPKGTETPPAQAHLEALLEENLAFAKDNNRLLRLIRRDAMFGLVAKIVLWLILLGVPLFFIGSYIGPLFSAFSGATAGGAGVPSPFGVPSKDQVDKLIQEYKEVYQ